MELVRNSCGRTLVVPDVDDECHNYQPSATDFPQ